MEGKKEESDSAISLPLSAFFVARISPFRVCPLLRVLRRPPPSAFFTLGSRSMDETRLTSFKSSISLYIGPVWTVRPISYGKPCHANLKTTFLERFLFILLSESFERKERTEKRGGGRRKRRAELLPSPSAILSVSGEEERTESK